MITERMLNILSNSGLSGLMAERFAAAGMDPGVARPYIAEDGKFYVTLTSNGQQVMLPSANATLRKDEWIIYDTAVVNEARQRLPFTNMLINRGLVFNVDGMAKTVLQHEDLNDMTAAVVSMDGVTRGDRDRANFELRNLPLPIVHKDFRLSARVLNESRQTGDTLDATQAEQATRQVAESIETMHVIGTGGVTYGGGTVYGLTNHPNRNQVTINNWLASATTGEDVLQDVIDLKQALLNDRFFGPYALLIPTNYETVLDGEFKTNSDKSIRMRLAEIASIEEIMVVDKLASSNVVLVQLTTDVVRTINGLAPTPVQWETDGGMMINFKVMAIRVPQIRATQALRSGVAHGTT